MSDYKKQERRRNKSFKQEKSRADKQEQLLRDIRDLGGDEADLALVAGLDSDADEAAPVERAEKKAKKPEDLHLQRDLAKLAKELGLNGNVDQVTVDDDAASDDNDEEEEAAPVKVKEKRKAEVIVQEAPRTDGLLIEPTALWHAIPLAPLTPPAETPADFQISRQLAKAQQLLTQEAERYATSDHVKSSDRQFLSTIMRSGTLTDRISAITLVIQESPLHAVKSMDTLLAMCKKKSRNEAVSSIAAVKDLLQGSVLPDRKLRFFKDMPVTSPEITDAHLVLFAFEDYLKRFYFELLGLMEQLSLDSLPFPRNHMVRYFYELLKDKPEQEANLLRLLVNKLGDRDKKIASKCSHFLLQLQQAHPAMKGIIVAALEQALFKPGMPPMAQYYTVITMNQTILSQKETAVANSLVQLYFQCFAKLIQHKETAKSDEQEAKKNRKQVKREKEAEQADVLQDELNQKMISAVLTGVNRAFPFADLPESVFEENLDILYRITHASNFNTSIQALILLLQVSTTPTAKQQNVDRFYRTLYESISDPRLLTSSKQALYLNLLFKALRGADAAKCAAFAKRLVQSCVLHQPPFICALFYLLGELERSVPGLRQLYAEGTEEAGYDGRGRDPRFCQAGGSKLWELLPFLTHFHPSVCLFARCLVQQDPMPSKPDLTLHTLTHFLDRFVYRNAKTKATTKGGSIMQPMASDTLRTISSQARSAQTQEPVNTEAFWRQSVKKVAADEVFFHKYFNDKVRQPKAKHAADAEEEEDEVWSALVKSRPDVEAPDESDVDLDDFEGLSDLSEEDEDEEADEEDDEGEEEGSDSAFLEDMDDLLPSDEEASEASEEDNKKRKATDDEKSEKKKKKVKLPAFASAEEYAHLL
ncbi:CBF/Mak21 family-domain-containing protein [Protomyces lactucae-debilis]|uniref:CBF/Mak21 family-domain-containing protein n=1 Tax=Protomyces lactucae-debilis TaxID=2754530 RepID=A0A1Y2EV77_PROLT|nr:CBF/Mak21 family-domain-containing protein [Protomyces lactucae-debilis]ORY75459.1 CBF/Mak21 family-domain-containing protein [Protomyces lactucae-debilis]